MKYLRIIRYDIPVYKDQGTLGSILDENYNFLCHSLELDWKENKQGISCIPKGEYESFYVEKTASGKFRDVYLLKNVPKRSGVLIHKGNFGGQVNKGYKSHILGCILPCSNFIIVDIGRKKTQVMGTGSGVALAKVHNYLNRESFKVIIR